MANKQRTLLQSEADRIDLEIFRAIQRLDELAQRIPVAASKLRGASRKLYFARVEVRSFMHPADREVTQ